MPVKGRGHAVAVVPKNSNRKLVILNLIQDLPENAAAFSDEITDGGRCAG
jgi:hypothetical protein